MHPAAIMRELRDGQHPAVHTGLSWLLLGAALTVLATALLVPSVGGLRGLPGHVLDRPVEEAVAPVRPAVPRLTPRQKVVARRTAVRVALAEVGVREQRINNARRIVLYRYAVRGPGEKPQLSEPWCADFVSWAWRRAGVPIGWGGLGSDYVPELAGWARLTGRWHAARKGYRPQPGDLVVYSAGGSSRGHIGMVVNVRNGRMLTVEGNFRDRVMRRKVKPWAPYVTGFISPV